MPDAARVPRLLLRLRRHRRRRRVRVGEAGPVVARPATSSTGGCRAATTRPWRFRTTPGRSISPSPAGRGETRLLLARAALLPPLRDGRRRVQLAAVDRRARRRLRSLSAARRRPRLHVHAARRVWPLPQPLGTAARLHAAPHGRRRRRRADAFLSRNQRVASRRCWPRRADRLHRAGTTSTARRPTSTASGSSNPDGTDAQRPVRQLHRSASTPATSRGRFPARGESCSSPGRTTPCVGGSLVLVDPQRMRLDPETGEDDFDAIETPDARGLLPGSPGLAQELLPQPVAAVGGLSIWSRSASIRCRGMARRDSTQDPRPACTTSTASATSNCSTATRASRACIRSRSSPRPRPPIVAGTPRLACWSDEGGVPADRRAAEPACRCRRIGRSGGCACSRSCRRRRRTSPTSRGSATPTPKAPGCCSGTVPVEADGSAYFRVPARKPLYFQAVDAEGRAVQSMRSVGLPAAGRAPGCVGCHEPPPTARRAGPDSHAAGGVPHRPGPTARGR